eukprot:scaffold2808_cov255-Pinguiococcus_pyrenoidosus.AAC.36
MSRALWLGPSKSVAGASSTFRGAAALRRAGCSPSRTSDKLVRRLKKESPPTREFGASGDCFGRSIRCLRKCTSRSEGRSDAGGPLLPVDAGSNVVRGTSRQIVKAVVHRHATVDLHEAGVVGAHWRGGSARSGLHGRLGGVRVRRDFSTEPDVRPAALGEPRSVARGGLHNRIVEVGNLHPHRGRYLRVALERGEAPRVSPEAVADEYGHAQILPHPVLRAEGSLQAVRRLGGMLDDGEQQLSHARRSLALELLGVDVELHVLSGRGSSIALRVHDAAALATFGGEVRLPLLGHGNSFPVAPEVVQRGILLQERRQVMVKVLRPWTRHFLRPLLRPLALRFQERTGDAGVEAPAHVHGAFLQEKPPMRHAWRVRGDRRDQVLIFLRQAPIAGFHRALYDVPDGLLDLGIFSFLHDQQLGDITCPAHQGFEGGGNHQVLPLGVEGRPDGKGFLLRIRLLKRGLVTVAQSLQTIFLQKALRNGLTPNNLLRRLGRVGLVAGLAPPRTLGDDLTGAESAVHRFNDGSIEGEVVGLGGIAHIAQVLQAVEDQRRQGPQDREVVVLPTELPDGLGMGGEKAKDADGRQHNATGPVVWLLVQVLGHERQEREALRRTLCPRDAESPERRLKVLGVRVRPQQRVQKRQRPGPLAIELCAEVHEGCDNGVCPARLHVEKIRILLCILVLVVAVFIFFKAPLVLGFNFQRLAQPVFVEVVHVPRHADLRQDDLEARVAQDVDGDSQQVRVPRLGRRLVRRGRGDQSASEAREASSAVRVGIIGRPRVTIRDGFERREDDVYGIVDMRHQPTSSRADRPGRVQHASGDILDHGHDYRKGGFWIGIDRRQARPDNLKQAQPVRPVQRAQGILAAGGAADSPDRADGQRATVEVFLAIAKGRVEEPGPQQA